MTEATPLKIAIVGTAPTSRLLAPFADNSWQIWACSGGNVDQLPRVNVWFEMHMRAEMLAEENKATTLPFYKWLREKSDAGMFDVVMPEFNVDVPKAIPYPLDDMIKAFGRNWFTSTMAYMLAVAIARGATEIGLFGVDMAAGQEHYEAQRAGCIHFIELAQARGIQVHVPMESCLMAATPLYGYWEGTPFGRRVNALAAEIQRNANAAMAQEAAAHDQRVYHAGALEQLRYLQRTWVDGSEASLNLGNLPAIAAEFDAKQAAAETVKIVETAWAGEVPSADISHHSGEFPDNASEAFKDLAPPAKLNGAGVHIGGGGGFQGSAAGDGRGGREHGE